MKKIFLLIVITLISLPGFAQWTTTGNNLTTDKNVGIGKNPQYKLDIDGTVASKNLKINFNEYIGSNMTDVFNYKGRNMGHYALSWGTDSWANDGASLWQSGYGGIKFFTYGKCRMAINKAGNVGIGTENPQYKLDIDGTVASKNLKINFNEYIGSNMTDVFNYKGRNMGHYALSWGTDSWANDGASLWQSGYGGIKFFTYGKCRMAINKAGNVGIGTENPQATLDVKGNIRATEVKIEDISSWSDFVFEKDYELLSLSEVERHIDTYKHLPDVPSEAQVKKEGVNVVEMQAKLLQKIEELTLYVIKQDKEIQELKKKVSKK